MRSLDVKVTHGLMMTYALVTSTRYRAYTRPPPYPPKHTPNVQTQMAHLLARAQEDRRYGFAHESALLRGWRLHAVVPCAEVSESS